MTDRIPCAGPWITQKEIDYVTDAVTNAWYADHAMYHTRFERAFADYVGTKHAVSLPHCTAALHLSLLALNIGPGDEVIVPDVTWIASAAPITYVGATTVFADIDAATWCLDADAFERAITPRTKAVIVVELYGSMPDWPRILEIAERHGVAVIEDSAEAVGSEFRGGRAGSFGLTGTFSFHGTKTLTTGEGGMLVTDDDAVLDRVLRLRDHGRAPGDRHFYNTEIAYKYKMSSMQAAIGLAQTERIDELVDKKREIFGWYREELGDRPWATLNDEGPGIKNSFWMSTVIIDPALGLDKTTLMARLADDGIDARPIFSPLSALPAFAGKPGVERAQAENVVSYRIGPHGINLPSAMIITRPQVKRVCDVLKRAVEG